MYGLAVRHHSIRRQERSRWLIHERHELIRKTRHSATNANAADVGAAANPRNPAALTYIALNHRSPTAKLNDAFFCPIFLGKLSLLVVTAAITAFVNGLTKQPRWSQGLIERNHRGPPCRLIQQIE